MKTKDFIKLLQEEDPSGECHIRINDEPILFVESKPGYWDGPYNYLEEVDGKLNWVQTTDGNKIDINTMDLFCFAEKYNGDWEEMKKHIIVKYGYLDGGQKENEFMKLAEEECKHYKKLDDDWKINNKNKN